jgi:hypothetical protein
VIELKLNPNQGRAIGEKKEKGIGFLLTWGSSLGRRQQGREGECGAGAENGWSRGGAQGSRARGGGTQGQRTGEQRLIYRWNLNIQRPKFNYSHMIHPTSESSMWISKRSRFIEIFVSAVSDRLSEKWFKKTNFQSTPEPLSNIFFVLHWHHGCECWPSNNCEEIEIELNIEIQDSQLYASRYTDD